MKLPVVDRAQGRGKLVRDPPPQRCRLRELEVVRVGPAACYSLVHPDGIRSEVSSLEVLPLSENHRFGAITTFSGLRPSQAPHQEKVLFAMIW